MKPVLIFGAGQVAEVFASYLRFQGHTIAAHIVDSAYVEEASNFRSYYFPLGLVVYPTDKAELRFLRTDYSFVVGMSFKGLNHPRAEKYAAMIGKGFEPLVFVDKRASVFGPAVVGKGSFVMDENTIQPHVSIGENCILWSGNHVGHHTKIGNHVFIASHAVIGGACEIGDNCFIGVNATIRDGVKIGPRCVIGAGALILSDCEADGVYGAEPTPRSKVPSNRLRGI